MPLAAASQPWRQRFARAVAVASCAWVLASLAHADTVRGVIVQLVDAPAHEPAATGRESTLHADAIQAAQRQRLRRVLQGTRETRAAASAPAPTLRPVGRAAHLVDFGHALPSAELDALLARLRASPEVAWAEPNERETAQQSTTPSDPFFTGTDGQWWLQQAGGSDANAIDARLRGVPNLQRAWIVSTGSPNVPVAVLDNGITAHPELQGVSLPGIDLVGDPLMANDGDGRDADPSDPGDWVSPAELASSAFNGCPAHDSSWHGTIVSGMLAARTDNQQGVAAVGWDARIVPVRVAGRCGAEVADIIDGLRWAAGLPVGTLPVNANPVRVISLSYGSRRPCNSAYQSVIDELRARGVLLVAAAGNGPGAVSRPANCRGVVAVTALNRDGFKASYANLGPEVTLATVGGDNPGAMLSDGGLLTLYNAGTTQPGEGIYARSFGTSFAVPIVAGTAALMLSVNPGLTIDQLAQGLQRSARPHVSSPWLAACSAGNASTCACTADTCGAGLLDAEQALFYARDPSAYVAPSRGADVLDNVELANAGLTAQPAQPALGAESTGGGAIGLPWLLALACALARLPAPRGLRRPALRAARRRA